MCATIVLMIVFALIVYGLCLGSFVNALVWRVYAQDRERSAQKPKKTYLADLSISKGRSMCPDCHHQLAAKDLIPVLSWLSLKGKCRYCARAISSQYPLVELITAVLFVISYLYWPGQLVGLQIALFSIWLLLLVGFMALVVYDARWMLLPTRLIYPVGALTVLFVLIRILLSDNILEAALGAIAAIAVGGGIFWILYQVSAGKWIGGGDIRLGWILGALAGTPGLSLLVIFLASLLGCLYAIPPLFAKKLKVTHEIPFGPFLIASMFLVFMFGNEILAWYKRVFLISV